MKAGFNCSEADIQNRGDFAGGVTFRIMQKDDITLIMIQGFKGLDQIPLQFQPPYPVYLPDIKDFFIEDVKIPMPVGFVLSG